MSSRVFFVLTLVLPFLWGAVGYFIPKVDFLLLFIAVGGIPYIVTAVGLAIGILKATSIRMLLVLSAVAPILFGALLSGFVQIIGNVPGSFLSLREYVAQLSQTAALGALVALAYVCMAWLLWILCRKLNWVRNEFAT